jgi:hypothetical protein
MDQRAEVRILSDACAMDERADAARHPLSPDLLDLRQRQAETYARGADVLEQTARLADEHADREEGQGSAAFAAKERTEAAKARKAAAR